MRHSQANRAPEPLHCHVDAAPELAIAEIAGAQRGLITHQQLRQCGLAPGAIHRRRKRGWLHPVHRGVYAVGHAALPELGRETAALLACGRDSILSHLSSGAVRGWLATPDHVDVTVVGRRCGRADGIRVHRVERIDRADVCRHQGLLITSPARALLEIAGELPTVEMERVFDEAIHGGLVTIGAVRAMLARTGPRHGCSILRALAYADRSELSTRSRAEKLTLRLIRRGGLPEPEVNVKLGRYEADLLWRREQVVIEFDSYGFHGSRAAFESDRRKDAELAALGFLVIRVTWRQLQHEPEAVLVRLAAALARRAAA